MPPLTTTGYLILGMLADRDWTAYELAEQIGNGVTEVWPRAQRQLYNAPKRLVAEGLARAHTEPSGRRKRTRYEITPAGRRALHVWLTTTPAPPALEFEAMVRVLVADEGTLDDLRATIGDMAEHARATRALFVSHARFMLEDGGDFTGRRHLLAMANRFMIDHFTNIIDWTAWASVEIATWSDTTEPAVSHLEATNAMLRSSIARGTSGTHVTD